MLPSSYYISYGLLFVKNCSFQLQCFMTVIGQDVLMIGVVLMVMPYIFGKTLSLGLQRNNPQLLTHPLRVSGFESQSPSILWFDNIGAITYVLIPFFMHVQSILNWIITLLVNNFRKEQFKSIFYQVMIKNCSVMCNQDIFQ